MYLKFYISFFLLFFLLTFPSIAEDNKDKELFLKGLNSFYSNNLDSALNAFEAYIKKHPDSHEALFYRARILSYKGQTGKSVDVLKKAISLCPERVFYLYKLADFYLILGDKENFISLCKEIKKKNPGDPELYYKLADFYKGQGKIADAINQLETALIAEEQPSAKTLYRLGQLCLKAGYVDKGVDYITKASDMEPDNKELLNLGNFFYGKGNLSVALNYYLKYIALDLSNPSVQRRLGYIYYLSGDLKKSAFYFSKVTAIDSKNPEGFYNLGIIYYLAGEYDKSLEQFTIALNKKGDRGANHYNLGCTYFKQGNLDASLKEYTAALDSNPKNNTYLYASGAMNYLHQETERSFNKLNSIEVKPVDGFLTRGITYRAKGQIDIETLNLIIPAKDLPDFKN